MTLHIINSNKVENLHDELCFLLKQNPLSNPFDVETIVCPSTAMARWINVRFTKKMGIAAHYDYPMPSSWVWKIAEHLLPDVPQSDPLQRDLTTWKIYFALQSIENNPSFDSLKHYLKGDIDGTKCWSLAKKIALVFDRYQLFRPEMIKQWSKGEGEHWQSDLWLKITQHIKTDRVELLHDLIHFLVTTSNVKQLPQRVIFFSVSALPAILFNTIQALAKHIDVYFFILSPSEHYWSDLITLKQQAKQRLIEPELNSYFSTGNELLASWGRQGQVFQDMLLNELDDSISLQYDAYDNQFDESILQQLQHSLFELDDSIKQLKSDSSIRFNHCYSPLRECEVLHDQLLSLLENNDITPEDILVIVPNIQAYSPMIEAVFKKTLDQDDVKPFIPWNLSDSSLQTQRPIIQHFLNLLALPASRFNATSIIEFLDCPELLKQFNLESHDKETIREFITQAPIHWGFDAKHKAQFNVPAMDDNTWKEALNRFIAAYAIDENNDYGVIAPLAGFTSSRAQIIAQFMWLLKTLNHWREKLSYARSMSQWQLDLNDCLNVFFSDIKEGQLQSIRDVIDELVVQSQQNETLKAELISLSLITKQLHDYFDNEQSQQRFFSGGVTFCGMRPMRSVPFKVIAMLGMNEHDFPRHNNPIEFDLMAKHWQPGDLLISDEDRYLFLEAVLCTRHTLIISHCAFSLKDNTPKEPSLLVSELRDYLDLHFIDQSNDSLLSDALTIDYAMHVFSSKNYSSTYRSYNQFWCSVANNFQQPSQNQIEPSANHYSEDELTNEIDLDRLIHSVKDPVKTYFNNTLNIRLFDEADLDDDETFSLNALQQWQIKDRLLNQQIKGEDNSLQLSQLKSMLPHGAHQQTSQDQLFYELESQLESINHYLLKPIREIYIDLNMGTTTIVGQVQVYEGLGQLIVTPSKFGSRSFIEGWIKHCALCACQQLAQDEVSVLSFKDKTIAFKPVTTAEAIQYLNDMLHIKQLASDHTIMLLAKCSFIYQYELHINDLDKANTEALKQWHGNERNEAANGEKENDYVQLAFQSFYENPLDLFEHDDFKHYAKLLYANAFKHCSLESL